MSPVIGEIFPKLSLKHIKQIVRKAHKTYLYPLCLEESDLQLGLNIPVLKSDRTGYVAVKNNLTFQWLVSGEEQQ